MSRRSRRSGALLAALVLAACASTPTPAPSPSAAVVVEPSATRQPSPPAGLGASASVERLGLRLTLSLDRNPMPAGEPTWISTRLENISGSDRFWFHGGCLFTTLVTGTSDVAWRSGVAPENANLAAFQVKILADMGIKEQHARLEFQPPQFIGTNGFVCTDNLVVDRIGPSEIITQRAQWDGNAAFRLGLPPTGRVDIHGVAGSFAERRDEPTFSGPDHELSVHMPGWVAGGRDPNRLDPAEAVDVALTDASFTVWLTKPRLGIGYGAVLRFDPATARWLVGLIDRTDLAGHFAIVDSRTRAVVRVEDRTWDVRSEGDF